LAFLIFFISMKYLINASRIGIIIGPIITVILTYLLPTFYHKYRISPFIEYDQHLLVLLVSIGSVIFLLYFLSNSSKSIIISDLQIVIIVGLLFILVIHKISGIQDDYRVVQIIILLIILLYMLRYSLNIKPSIINYLFLLFIPVLYESTKGIFQFFTESNDITFLSTKGSLFNSGTLGNYICSFLPLIFGWTLDQYYNSIKKNNKYILNVFKIYFGISTIAISIICLLLTYARAAWLGSILGIFLVAIYFYRKYSYKNSINVSLKTKFISKIIFILLTISVSILFCLKIDSIYGRWQIYKVDLLIIRKNTILGIGIGKVYSHFNEYQALYFSTNLIPVSKQILATNTFEAFNIIFQLFAEIGIVSFLLILLIILLHYNIFKNKFFYDYSIIQLSALAALIGIITASLFSNPFHHLPIVVNLIVLLSIIPYKNKVIIFHKYIIKYLLCILCLLFFLYISYNEILRIKALVNWEIANEEIINNDFSTADLYYRKAMPILHSKGEFTFNYGAELYIFGSINRSIELLELSRKTYASSELYTYLGSAYMEKKEYKNAEFCYIHAINMMPTLLYPKYKLFTLYQACKQPLAANKMAKRIITYPVKIPSIATYQMQDSARHYLNLEIK